MILQKDTAGEGLNGAIDGVNKTFVTSADYDAERVTVYLNGLLKVASLEDGYTLAGLRTVNLKEAPQVGDTLEIQYMLVGDVVTVVSSTGGALGGVPSPPELVALAPTVASFTLRPQIMEATEVDEDC